MWSEGIIGVPTDDGKNIPVMYWVKHYQNPSQFGIDGGRISKLTLKIKGEVVCHYDRGWDIKPTCEAAEIALKILKCTYDEEEEQ